MVDCTDGYQKEIEETNEVEEGGGQETDKEGISKTSCREKTNASSKEAREEGSSEKGEKEEEAGRAQE